MSTHFEGLGDRWFCLLDDPTQEIPHLAAAVLAQGGTREVWKHNNGKKETMLMAFPPEMPIKAAVVIQGKARDEDEELTEAHKLSPKTACPLLEGLPNDLTVETTYTWASGVEADISAFRNEGGEPLWFYTPLYFRDKDSLTPGVRHTFLLAGMAMGLRKALVDEMTITEGPSYEQHAALFLAENPDKTRLDVPQLKIPLVGSRIIMPGQFAGDYQMRAPISAVEETNFGDKKVYMLTMQFGLNTDNPLNIMLYASEKVCKGYVPKAGDEIDGYIWLQARIIDF